MNFRILSVFKTILLLFTFITMACSAESFDDSKTFTVTNGPYSQGFTFSLKNLDKGEVEIAAKIDATPHVRELTSRSIMSVNSSVSTIDLVRPWKNGPSSIKGKFTLILTAEGAGYVRFDGKLIVVNVGELEIHERVLSL